MHVLAGLDYGQIGLGIGITHRLQKTETFCKVPLIQIIEKQSPHAAGFIAMLEVKITITPFLEARVDILAKRRTGLLCRTVPVHHILQYRVKGREVVATSKPPYGLLTVFLGQEKTQIGMAGGHVRIAWVYHQ